MPLIENDDMSQTISADGTDHTFNKWILPRRSRSRDNILDTQTLDPPLDDLTIDVISISQQITWGRIKRKGLHELLICPLRSGMLSYIEVHNVMTVMTEDDEYVENTKCCCRNGEEINCSQTVSMVYQKRSPCLRRRFSPMQQFWQRETA